MFRVVFRTDASVRIGSGHVVRCLALAHVLREHGAEAHFVCRELAGNMSDLVRAQDFPVHMLPAGRVRPGAQWVTHAVWLEEHWQTDAEQTKAIMRALGAVDCVIVDHYALDAQWERQLRPQTGGIFVIDDLADRAHDCDLLLDQNRGVVQAAVAYQDLLSPGSRGLFGPKFALLRPEFGELRAKALRTRQDLKRILVFLGGADPDDVTSKAIDALALGDFPGLEIHVVVGQSNPNAAAVAERCALHPNIRFHLQTGHIARLMSESDLAIGGAGTSTWERCALGLPALVISIADNQVHIAGVVAAAGACRYLGPSPTVAPEQIVREIQDLFADPAALPLMSRAAASVTDGKGARRVARAIVGGKLHISILSDADSWIRNHVEQLRTGWLAEGHKVVLVHDPDAVPPGDCAFFLGCSRVVRPEVLARNTNNLVVHESALPIGRGWAPLTWQVLEGRNEVPVSLIEAEQEVDSGDLYLRETLAFSGHELCGELRAAQGGRYR